MGDCVEAMKLWPAALAAAVIGGCSGSAPTPTPSPAPIANLPVTLSTASTNVTAEEGQSANFAFTASYTGTSSSPIVADVQVAGKRIELNGTPTASGGSLWARDTTQPSEGYVHEGESVAVDDNYVYYFGGGNLFALNRNGGTIAHKIRNPYFTSFGLSYHGSYRGAPILGRNGRIITFTDNRGPQSPLALMAFSLSSTTPLWRSAATYLGHPALRDDTLFAIRSDGRTIDMINAGTGTVSGSIDLGSSRGSLASNIIVTGSHLFVANATATYAIDLQQSTYPVVWTAAQGGALAITPDNMLVISAANGVYAYKLTS